MRNSREFAALGITLKRSISRPECFQYLATASNHELLILGERRFGLTWPVMAEFFRQNNIHYETLKISDRVYLVLSAEAESSLDELSTHLKIARDREIFIGDLGFVDGKSKPQFEFRSLALPVTALVVVMLTAIALTPKSEESEPVSDPVCLTEMSPNQLERWLGSELSSLGALTPKGQINVESLEGAAQILVSDAIGSTVLLSVELRCVSGAKKSASFRYDLKAKSNPAVIKVAD